MEKINNFQVTKTEKIDQDILRLTDRQIEASINVLRFKDADTQLIVSYFPALDISGYGPNEEKAMEMAVFSLKDFFAYLLNLPSKKREDELRSLGWKNDKLKHKEFSKAFIDGDSELKTFAAEGKIERLTLVA